MRTAQAKVEKLDMALEVMVDVEAPAVEALRAELKRARVPAKVPVARLQVEQCRLFNDCSKRRVAQLQAELAEEVKRSQEAEVRWPREAANPRPIPEQRDMSPDLVAEVANSRAQLASTED